MSPAIFWLAISTQLILACSVSITSNLQTIDFILWRIDVIPTNNSFMYAEVTSPNTLTSREEERSLCQPQKHSLICRSSKEMDESVLLSLQVQIRNMHNNTTIGFGFWHDSNNYQGLSLCYPSQPSASTDNTNFGLDNYRSYAQPHAIIVN